MCLLCWVILGSIKAQIIGPPDLENATSACVNETQFILPSFRLPFEQAKEVCVNLGATLARISNKQENDFVASEVFGASFGASALDRWIGIQS